MVYFFGRPKKGQNKVYIECVHCHAIKNKIKNHALNKVKKIVIL